MVLLTGGAGYIGSHTYIELVNAGFKPIIVDNFYNSKPIIIKRLEEITNQSVKFYTADVRDKDTFSKIFEENNISSVIHFAGYKAVGESVKVPLEYYKNNINCALTLLEVMLEHGVNNIVFSSSATVYGVPKTLPILEDSPLFATSPYARTKLFIEEILRDVCNANANMKAMILRYFNPIGAHHSGIIGEDPNGIPNNLVPYIAQVASGKLEEVNVFGNDYDTSDGTGVRDYIHVVDLAKGHVVALQNINNISGHVAYNLGTGIGYSVLEIIKNFQEISGKEIKYK